MGLKRNDECGKMISEARQASISESPSSDPHIIHHSSFRIRSLPSSLRFLVETAVEGMQRRERISVVIQLGIQPVSLH